VGAVALAAAGAAGWFFFFRPASNAADAAAPATTSPASPGPAPTTVPVTTLPPPPPDARALLQAGRYPEAASFFAEDLKAAGRGTATIQLLIACSSETVEKAVANVGAMELVIVPHRYEGRDCYRLCWGVYPTTQAAATATRMLPEYFRQPGVRPRVTRVAEILP
jgi:septal ring-binding cell division protein DamX